MRDSTFRLAVRSTFVGASPGADSEDDVPTLGWYSLNDGSVVADAQAVQVPIALELPDVSALGMFEQPVQRRPDLPTQWTSKRPKFRPCRIGEPERPTALRFQVRTPLRRSNPLSPATATPRAGG